MSTVAVEEIQCCECGEEIDLTSEYVEVEGEPMFHVACFYSRLAREFLEYLTPQTVIGRFHA